MPAGSIILDLLMRTGAFETDTDRAAKKLKGFQKQVSSTALSIKSELIGALAALGISFSFDQLVKVAADFKDLEEKAGGSAESFASLAVSAGTTNTSMSLVGDAAVKLTKNLQGVDDESKAAGAALTALGVPIEEFKRLDPASRFEVAAQALAGFREGTEKTAVAVALFGKTGAELLPFLKELEQAGGRQSILTQKQIELADQYADRQAKLATQLKLYAAVATTDALPAINDLATAAKELIAEFINLDSAGKKLSGKSPATEFAEKVADALAFVVDAGRGVVQVFQSVGTAYGAAAAIVAAVTRGEFAQAKQIAAEARADIDKILSAESFRDKLARARSASVANDKQRSVEDRGFDPRTRLNFDGANTDKGDASKKLLDQRLKSLESAIARERDLLATRNKFLDLFNAQGLVSVRDYYAAQRSIVEEATASQTKLIDQQIAALQKQKAGAGKDADRVDLQTKINDLLAKRSKLQQEAGERGIELAVKQAEDERKLAAQIEAVSANVLELRGNLGAAAAIRFDQQNLDLVRRLTAEGNTEALKLVDALRKATVAQAEFSRAAEESGRINDRLRNAEESLAITRQLGATTELGALKRLGEARQAAIAQLEAQVQAQEAIARASGSPALVANAERARIELEKLKATADPLGDKFRTLFSDSASSPLADFITGTKSAKDAFASFVDSVVAGIARIVAQQLAESAFGGSGGGGLGGAVGAFFGGIFGGAKAGGGDVMAGRSYWVGEDGPERFVPRTAGTVLSASESRAMGGRPITYAPTFLVQGQIDRRTQDQIAARAASGLARVAAADN